MVKMVLGVVVVVRLVMTVVMGRFSDADYDGDYEVDYCANDGDSGGSFDDDAGYEGGCGEGEGGSYC